MRLGLGLASLLLVACASTSEQLLVPGSLQGWHAAPGGTWTWEGDVLVGRSAADESRHGLLITDGVYADFRARLEFRAVRGCSGFYFRVEESGDAVGVSGFQAEVEPSLETGGLYETAGRGWVVRPDPDFVASIYEPGEWSEMVVTATGPDVEVRLNGEVTARLESDPGRRRGRFALQLHGNQDLHVEFRALEVTRLD